jgi:membrane-associated phospholipid phosphatase
VNYSNGDFGKKHLQNQVQSGLNFDSNLDNILLFVPAIEMYSANLFRIKSANTIGNQTKYLLISSLATIATTQLLKRTFNEERPDKSNNNSFPSGHTANAFSMATVLYHEYKDSNRFLAYSGFAFATTTAAFRVLNNKHFTSDVLVGAGIGIAITELVYNFKPLQRWQPFKSKKRQVFISPMYKDNAIGLTSIIRF